MHIHNNRYKRLVTSQTSTINILGQRQALIFCHSRANYFFHFSLVATKHAKQNILKNEKIDLKFKKVKIKIEFQKPRNVDCILLKIVEILLLASPSPPPPASQYPLHANYR
jgi:hypothetical protein